MNVIYLPVNNLLIADSGIKEDQKQPTNQPTLRKSTSASLPTLFPLPPPPRFPPQSPHPTLCSAPLVRQQVVQETGPSVCMLVPSPAAAPSRLHLSAPAQAAPWLQPRPRHGLLSFLLPGPVWSFFLLLWPRFSFRLVLTTLTLRCFRRGVTDSPEDGLSRALRWVCWSRL